MSQQTAQSQRATSCFQLIDPRGTRSEQGTRWMLCIVATLSLSDFLQLSWLWSVDCIYIAYFWCFSYCSKYFRLQTPIAQHYESLTTLYISHLPTGNLESPINAMLFRLQENTGSPKGNPHKYRESMQTPHRIAPRRFKSRSDSANYYTSLPPCCTIP